jgi:hypothetical protein
VFTDSAALVHGSLLQEALFEEKGKAILVRVILPEIVARRSLTTSTCDTSTVTKVQQAITDAPAHDSVLRSLSHVPCTKAMPKDAS